MKALIGVGIAIVVVGVLLYVLFQATGEVIVAENGTQSDTTTQTTESSEATTTVESTVIKEETIGSARLLELGLTVLPDGIPVTVDGISYVLTDPTARYAHGVLGDTLEAGSLSIVEGDEVSVIDFSPRVFEGLIPLIADIDGDGIDDIITTLSGDGAGSQIVAYDRDGKVIARSDTLPSGWRHVLTVAPFGPNGEVELVNVVMPHVKKEVEFLKYENGKLVKTASISGYSTHTIGSRNLGLFAVVDVLGRQTLVVPTEDFNAIATLQRTESGVKEVWRVPFEGSMYAISSKGSKVFVNGVELE